MKYRRGFIIIGVLFVFLVSLAYASGCVHNHYPYDCLKTANGDGCFYDTCCYDYGDCCPDVCVECPSFWWCGGDECDPPCEECIETCEDAECVPSEKKLCSDGSCIPQSESCPCDPPCEDDGNPCTEDKCVDGVCKHINKPDGTACEPPLGGKCKDGKCENPCGKEPCVADVPFFTVKEKTSQKAAWEWGMEYSGKLKNICGEFKDFKCPANCEAKIKKEWISQPPGLKVTPVLEECTPCDKSFSGTVTKTSRRNVGIQALAYNVDLLLAAEEAYNAAFEEMKNNINCQKGCYLDYQLDVTLKKEFVKEGDEIKQVIVTITMNYLGNCVSSDKNCKKYTASGQLKTTYYCELI